MERERGTGRPAGGTEGRLPDTRAKELAPALHDGERGRGVFSGVESAKSFGARPTHPHPSRGGRRKPPRRLAALSPLPTTGEGKHLGASRFHRMRLELSSVSVKQSFQGRTRRTSPRDIARRPVESTSPARGLGAAAARYLAPGTAGAARGTAASALTSPAVQEDRSCGPARAGSRGRRSCQARRRVMAVSSKTWRSPRTGRSWSWACSTASTPANGVSRQISIRRSSWRDW